MVSGGLLAMTGFLGFAGWKWLQIDRIEEMRIELASATFDAAQALAPLGGGLGAFVAWFNQEMPLELRAGYYFNHAHNEYAQWWLEGGLAATAVLLLALSAMAFAGARVLRPLMAQGYGPSPRLLGAGALIALLVVLAQSVVDYPLRTQALMTVCAMLAAVLVSESMRTTSNRYESGH